MEKLMNYEQALEYIMQFADYERLPRSGVVWDLSRVERLLERLGNPQFAAKTVHVAGTKGKGSTAAMITSILKKTGYRVGLFTSPHLLSYTERIRLDGEPITEDEWVRLTEVIKPEVEAVNAEGTFGKLTTFELYTTMAFVCFRDAGADYQVMEVGLGGRLDATNVVKPLVCVITSISYDHTEVLGNTLARIAGEKAGIIKPGAIVVCSPQKPEAMEVIEKTCREKGVRLVKAGEEITWQIKEFGIDSQQFQLKGLKGEYDLKIPLAGEHQVENAAVAVTVAELLAGLGTKITTDNIDEGLAELKWYGRLQVLRREPWLIVDVAHNTDSMEKLCAALQKHFEYNKLTFILGFSGDKDIKGMIARASAMTDSIILTRTRSPRAVKPESLVEEFQKHSVTPEITDNVHEALKLALEDSGKNDLVCAAGSVFVIAETMEEYAH
jgi:dihydrofolate synthase/folylpolyglutamate synthase